MSSGRQRAGRRAIDIGLQRRLIDDEDVDGNLKIGGLRGDGSISPGDVTMVDEVWRKRIEAVCVEGLLDIGLLKALQRRHLNLNIE